MWSVAPVESLHKDKAIGPKITGESPPTTDVIPPASLRRDSEEMLTPTHANSEAQN